MSPARRKLRRRRGGSTVVEAAIVINIALMIILGVFEYGRFIMIKQLMDNAAREGARYAVLNQSDPATTTDTIRTNVINYLAGMVQVQPSQINVYEYDPNYNTNNTNWKAASWGQGIWVQIDANYQPMIPTTFGILPNPLHLTATSVMGSEAD